jgi:hypothetical protein
MVILNESYDIIISSISIIFLGFYMFFFNKIYSNYFYFMIKFFYQTEEKIIIFIN